MSLCCNAIPYDGTLPYVFVSYKDNDAKSLAIIEWLHRAGVRVWYDKGVDHSQEWPAIVASKLKNSHVCILLLSSKYEKSGPCTDELSMIKKNQKPFIPVFLSVSARRCMYTESSRWTFLSFPARCSVTLSPCAETSSRPRS